MNTNGFLDKSYRTETQPLDQFILELEEIITGYFRKERVLTELYYEHSSCNRWTEDRVWKRGEKTNFIC